MTNFKIGQCVIHKQTKLKMKVIDYGEKIVMLPSDFGTKQSIISDNRIIKCETDDGCTIITDLQECFESCES